MNFHQRSTIIQKNLDLSEFKNKKKPKKQMINKNHSHETNIHH